MEMLQTVRQLWEHALWADGKLLEALRQSDAVSSHIVGELAHIAGTHELWLARLETRDPRAEVWPEASIDEIEALLTETGARFTEYLAAIGAHELDATVSYTNSAGQPFTNSVGDILVHVALHGQYHRGKVNLMLREAGLAPAPTDYIAFVRGAPAATRKTSP